MTWTLKPGLYRTRDDLEAEIFAGYNGFWYGRVSSLPARWSDAGISMEWANWDILPPAPVKKWRWVVECLSSGALYRSGCLYASAEECDRHNPGYKAIAKIEGSEVTE